VRRRPERRSRQGHRAAMTEHAVLIAGGGPTGLLVLRGGMELAPWADRLQVVDAEYDGAWELPVLGAVAAPTAVLVRPDGYVAWVGDGAQQGLEEALTTWFGPPSDA
jgi:hypothetical protein